MAVYGDNKNVTNILDEMLSNPTLAKLIEKSSSTNSDNIDDLFNQKDGEIALRYLRERLAP